MRRLFILPSLFMTASIAFGQVAFVPDGSTEIPITFTPHMTAVWSEGALVFVTNRFSDSPRLEVFDRSGRARSSTPITIPGASRINIYDNSFAHGADGSLAVVGTAFSDNNQGSAFLAIISANGSKQTLVRLSPFFPNSVAIARDGITWVAGHQWEEGKPRDHGQNLIRRYDKDGKMLDSLVTWASVSDKPHALAPDQASILVSNKDRVIWFSPNTQSYFEFALDGKITKRIQTPGFANDQIVSLAVCDDSSHLGVATLQNETTKASWGIFTVNRDKSDWEYTPRKEREVSLYGCDGRRIANRADYKTVSWFVANVN